MKTQEKSIKHAINGIHAVNQMEKSRDRRNGQYETKIVNGKTLLVMVN